MKLLLVHDYYRTSAPSGEDTVFRYEKALLEKAGVDLVVYEKFNDDIDESTLGKKVQLALSGAWSKPVYAELQDLISRTKPDVAHFHNTFPLVSPSAYAACQDAAVPVVQTLHNYRFICPGALLMRDGVPCEDCVGRSLAPALLHKCYRGSITATAAQVWTITSNRWRGTYKYNINRYIALTHFAASRFEVGGLPLERIEVKPNFLPDAPDAGVGGGGYAVYVGRLSAEKGVHTLISAWRHVLEMPLKVVGDGPLRAELEREVRDNALNVEFLGFRTREEILGIVGDAVVQIIPSECYEGFPMVILEAFACGTPVLVSRIGSLDEIVTEPVTGLKFEPGNVEDLVAKVEVLRADQSQLASMRRMARAEFDAKYTEDINIRLLMSVYANAIDDFARQRERA